MLAKTLFQSLWKLNLGWDDQVPPEMQASFTRWVEGFQILSQRKIACRYSDSCWRDVCKFELHAFGDASEKGYGACVFLRVVMRMALEIQP